MKTRMNMKNRVKRNSENNYGAKKSPITNCQGFSYQVIKVSRVILEFKIFVGAGHNLWCKKQSPHSLKT